MIIENYVNGIVIKNEHVEPASENDILFPEGKWFYRVIHDDGRIEYSKGMENIAFDTDVPFTLIEWKNDKVTCRKHVYIKVPA